MLKRIISGVVIIGVLALVLVFMYTPVLPIFISIVSAIGVFELNRIAKVKLPAKILSIAMAAILPFCIYELMYLAKILPVFIITMLIFMVRWHDELKIEQVAISIFSAIAVPCSLSCWISITIHEPSDNVAYYIILFAISCAWLSDVFAYFCGVAFGKHKMTPVISPKKTWEGALGGVVITAGVNEALYFFFASKILGDAMPWEWYAVFPISIFLSVISIFGDLSASVIKRQFGVKDYGKLIPGHGGVMDRFDSMLFVLPAMYWIFVFAMEMQI